MDDSKSKMVERLGKWLEVARPGFVLPLSREDVASASLTAAREEIASLNRINTNLRALLVALEDAMQARGWVLNAEDSRKFVDAILNAPEPNEALKAAAERYRIRAALAGGGTDAG